MELWLPITANALALFVVLFVSVVGFHILFMWIWPLGTKGWKAVDYVWLLLGTVAIIAGTFEVRSIVANAQIGDQRALAISTYEDVRSQVQVFRRFACFKFVRSAFSPAKFDEIQAEYDRVCEFVQRLAAQLPAEPIPNLAQAVIAQRPATRDTGLAETFRYLDDVVTRHLKARSAADAAIAATRRTPMEEQLFVLSPLILVIALALRLTKVTGELRLERLKLGNPS